MSTNWIWRVDMTVYTSGTTQVLRYASRGYTTPGSHPTIPNAYIEGRVDQPLLYRAELYGTDRTHGDSQIGQGEVILNNADGGMDFVRIGYGFDGRKIELYKIDPSNLSSDTLVWRGIMGDFTLDFDQFTVAVYDMTYIFNRALQPTKFAGTNSLPNGLEGTANDLQGKPKPKVYGSVFNWSPPLVNTSRLIYQLSDTSLYAGYSMTVYDKHVALSAGISRVIGDFTSGASVATVSSIDTSLDQITFTAAHGFTTADPVHVDATTTLPGGVLNTRYYYARVISTTVISLHPTATDATNNTNKVDITSAGAGTITVAKNRTPYGCYDWCSDASGSYIRTGSQPTLLTCDLANGSLVSLDAVFGQIISTAQTAYSDINALAFVKVDRLDSTAQSMTVGFVFDQDMTIYQALQELCRCANASLQTYVGSSSGMNQIVMQRLSAGGTSSTSLVLDDTNILPGSLKRIQPQDDERGIPPWRVTCNYKRNYTVMTGADVAGAAAADIAFTSAEYRSIQNDLSTVLSYYPSSPELSTDTGLVAQADASTYGSYLRTLLSPDTQMFTATTAVENFDTFVGLLPDTYGILLGETKVNVTNPRFGLGAGKNFGPLAFTIDRQAGTVEFTLWGG